MEKMKKNKKGFTIVELVIVIALIAILAAVLIPTFSNVINNAHESNDTVMVKNLNTILNAEEVRGNGAANMQEALDQAEEGGYVVSRISPTSTGDILWDQVSNRFLLINKKGAIVFKDDSVTEIADDALTAQAYRFWKITKNVANEKTKYSFYLDKNYTGNDLANLQVEAGLDVGEHTDAAAITYSTAAEQSVMIRTNGGTLTVDAKNAHVEHYGLADKVIIKQVKSESYHENGYVTDYLEARSGRVVIEKGASVSILAVNGDITVEQKTGSELFKVLPVGSNTINKEKVKVLETVKVGEKVTSDALENMKYGGGDGKTDGTAYELYTASHLAAFAKDVNVGKFEGTYVYAKLCENVNIGGMGWEPIGNAEHPFYGSFDGQNKTISGLTNKGYTPAEKLFGVTTAAKNRGTAYGFFGVAGLNVNPADGTPTEIVLKNMKFADVNIDVNNSNMLGVLLGADVAAAKKGSGYLNENYNGNVSIENVVTEGNIRSTIGTTIGGIVGKLYTKGDIKISDCTSGCNMVLSNSDISDIKVGGIFGFTNGSENSLVIDGCKSTGSITATVEGDNNSIKGEGNIYMGGIIAYHASNATGANTKQITISNCVVRAKMTIATTKNSAFAGLVYGARDDYGRVGMDGTDSTGATCTVNGEKIEGQVCKEIIKTYTTDTVKK